MDATYEPNAICNLVRDLEDNYLTGNIQVSQYVKQNFYEDISTIDAYLNSVHTSGRFDSQDREKPFFNIVLAARNIWFRATDLDRKNIRAKANKAKDYIASFLYSIHLQKWMNDENFGKFLNDWGLYLASYNSTVCKFVENKDGFHAMVMDWNKMIVDVVDFENNPKIEVLELTPAQLRKNKNYDQDQVEELINATTTRETQDGKEKDVLANYIKLYEVHGELPLSYLTGKEKDEDTYVQQMHVISYVLGKDKGSSKDFTLYSGREKQDPYLLTYLIPSVDGSISLMGSVKMLFDAQWMVNHTAKNIKDVLDMTSKIFYQTADSNYANKNVLDNIQTGAIMVWDKNVPNGQLTQLNNSHDISQLTSYSQQWQTLGQTITSTPDIMRGENMPSGTAFRQALVVQQESSSNFKAMIENKGLALEQMFRKFITPYLLKKMDTTEEISTTLDAYGIDKIDKAFIATEAVRRFNKKAVDAVLNDTELPDLGMEMQGVQQELNTSDMRFIKPSDIKTKTWKDVIGEFEGNIVYEITDENVEKQAILDTLMNMMTVLANPNNQAFFQTEQGKFLLNKTIEEVGKFSPAEVPQATPLAPMGGAVSAGGANNQPIKV